MFDMQKMLKQAQKMQDDMKNAQAELESLKFTGTAGSGAVSITANGKYEFSEVKISAEAAQDPGMLEDLVLTALNDLHNKVTKTVEEKMGAVTSGIKIPGLNLPGF